jgi:FKBP-type peptidyl-prolyl cis-trans isomerase FklB
MRVLIVCFFVLIGLTSYSQSKKELIAEVTKLKAEIAELKKPKEANLTDDDKKASYGLGVLIASNLRNQGGDSVDLESMYFGIQDVFKKNKLIIEEQECSVIVQGYMQEAMGKKITKMQAEGQAFLDANKLKEGVKVTSSGLQYQVISSGNGKAPTAADNVTVHYTGKLVDGTVFDSSVERNEPATFGCGQVIPGWTEALQLMHEGDKWMLFIPSELGYGERGAGGQIPPYSVLIFEVELIKVN